MQIGEKKSNPDFEADFFLGFKPENGHFWFTLTGPVIVFRLDQGESFKPMSKVEAQGSRSLVLNFSKVHVVSD